MTYKDKLKKFMELKEQQLRTLDNYVFGIYYDKNVEKAIDCWSEKSCEALFKGIKYNIIEEKADGLGISTCPFCLKYSSDCFRCEYAKIKGVCAGCDFNAYASIIVLSKGKEPLPNDFYLHALTILGEA
jgi:hypothetical protein